MAREHSTERRNEEVKAPAGGKFSTLFPLGPKEGWTQWCTNSSPATTEEKVLSFIPGVQKPSTAGSATTKGSSSSQSSLASSTGNSETSSSGSTPYESGSRRWNSQLVQLSGKDRALNEFSIERVGEKVEHNLVMLHGYGAGLGFFYKNFESLSRRPGWKLYALDMLGMGRSSRPPFKIRTKDHQGKITEAENWFIDALEEWRVKRGIDRMTLLGHSMGGYMVTAYALKYPGRIEKLLLVSPVGIPEDPLATKSDLPEAPTDSTATNEFLHDQNISLDNSTADIKPSETQQPGEEKPFQKPPPKWLVHLWEANISPFSIIRLSGPLGPRLTSGWTSRRFAHLPQEEALALHDYSYSLFRQRGSGEYALAYILAPGVFARDPLIRRMHKIGRQEGENGVPIVFMYGDNDWMDVNGGLAAEKKIKAENAKALEGKSEEEKRKDNGDAKVVVIEKAGHHLYLDNFEHFNRVMEEELQDVERRRS
ncbi:Alpha beta hydrolase fold protein [Lasiodiplodia theobromae]|uniref:Alpha beta hydrolase fold protein n=1 Tax=Lasiodiplodia theobromae TaxID=45133 RepID=UPI0015C359F8|nr:Alpha beta hydrolase fold protein [Lasiodiplodia theobromae]KAF4541141.1 Alpha beta hydrolase fold protein [Lasiodiplodia theobromae]